MESQFTIEGFVWEVNKMAKTAEMSNFTFKMDKTTREQFGSLCNELGLTMSAAALALIKQAVRNQSMSFSLRDENGFTREEAAELMRRIQEGRNNEVVRHDLMESRCERSVLAIGCMARVCRFTGRQGSL